MLKFMGIEFQNRRQNNRMEKKIFDSNVGCESGH